MALFRFVSDRPLRLLLPPLLVATVVIALAATAAVVMAPGSRPRHPVVAGAADPRSAARAEALTVLRHNQLPPGADLTGTDPALLRLGIVTQISSLEEKASRVWLAPGTVPGTVRFARMHPPTGFVANCTCGSPAVRSVTFLDERSPNAAIDLVVAPVKSGVAIKVTVIVAYVPRRPAWTLVDDAATSADVTIERVRRGGSIGGAPTVRRTLRGAAAHRLAAAVNALRPQAPWSCSGPVLMVEGNDALVFHERDRSITFEMPLSHCSQFVVQAPGHHPAYLASAGLDEALLAELGLPLDYGR